MYTLFSVDYDLEKYFILQALIISPKKWKHLTTSKKKHLHKYNNLNQWHQRKQNCFSKHIGKIFFSFIFISWRLITLQHCSGFCHTLTWISHGLTCTLHPDPPSHLPPHLNPLGPPSAPGPSTCLLHPTWAGDLFHYRF